MADIGWIKLYRQLQECWIWSYGQEFDPAHAWIDILLTCNHADKKILFDGKLCVIGRGQWLTSVAGLALRWGWGRKKVSNFLNLLESDGMILQERNSKRTLIKVLNYDVYQRLDESEGTCEGTCEGTAEEHQANISGTSVEHQRNTNKNVKNDKNVKNERNIYIGHFEKFWDLYPRKTGKSEAYRQYNARLKDGWSEDELMQACKAYADECNKAKREQQYIKQGKTFLSVNTPFVDYLQKGEKDGNSRSIGYESDDIDIPTEEEFAAFYAE